MAAGFSGPPLARELGLRDGMRVWFDALPGAVVDEIDEYALDLTFVANPAHGIDTALFFADGLEALVKRIEALRHQIQPDGTVWACWSAASAFDADQVTAAAEPLGYFVSRTLDLETAGTAIKLVIRKDLR